MPAILGMVLFASCSVEREGPSMHREESYIVPPGTELRLVFPGDRPRDVAVDYDSPSVIRLVTPPANAWQPCPPYRKVACGVHGAVSIHNESWGFHEIAVRVEPSPSPLCTRTPVPAGDLMGLRTDAPARPGGMP